MKGEEVRAVILRSCWAMVLARIQCTEYQSQGFMNKPTSKVLCIVEVCMRCQRPSHLHPPPSANPPRPHHLRRNHKPPTNNHHNPRKRLRAIIRPTTPRNQRAGDRGARQRRKAVNRKHHAHACARLAQIRREAAQPRREQRLDAAGGDAVEDGPRVQAAGAGDGDPRELADAGDQCRGDEDVDGAVAVCEVVGYEPADDADAVEEEEEVERVGVGEPDDVAREGGDVVEGEVDAKKALLHKYQLRVEVKLGQLD